MSVARGLAIAIAIGVCAPATATWAQPDDEDEDEDEDDEDAEDQDDEDEAKPKAKKKKKDVEEKEDDEEEEDDDFERTRDDGRPGGGDTADDENAFETSRFFVDKVDDSKTDTRTLVQGSLTSSSFVYRESGGAIAGMQGMQGVTTNSPFLRMFTDLRSQFDVLHIGGGRWDFRFDGRARLMNDPPNRTPDAGIDYGTRVQGGLFGKNEYEVKELWLVRTGERADLFFGRQIVADLGAVKFDGFRLDYAQSEKITILGFGGAYPLRGSRSITTDYGPGKNDDNVDIGRVIPLVGGGGAAYRTEKSYGAVGAVVIYPLKAEPPRIYASANGYFRRSGNLDLYHYTIIDLYGSAGFALTNLSLGANFKPSQRLRLTASLSRVDTETLNTTAQNFLLDPQTGGIIRNDIEVLRVASDQARVGVSASFGKVQQIEVSTAVAVRRRPEVALSDGVSAMTTQVFPPSQSVEVWAQALHRNLKGYRLGLDFSRIFALGAGGAGNAYARSASLGVRAFAAKDFKSGRGEWEAELGYTSAKDDNVGGLCDLNNLETCYGGSLISLIELGGTVYYRLKENVFAVGMLNVGYYNLSYQDATMVIQKDPSLISTGGFVRIGYRF
jgi:hypothetical protein